MIPDLITQNTTGSFEFLQGSILIVLSLALILMLADAIIETKSHNEFKSQPNTPKSSSEN